MIIMEEGSSDSHNQLSFTNQLYFTIHPPLIENGTAVDNFQITNGTYNHSHKQLEGNLTLEHYLGNLDNAVLRMVRQNQ